MLVALCGCTAQPAPINFPTQQHVVSETPIDIQINHSSVGDTFNYEVVLRSVSLHNYIVDYVVVINGRSMDHTQRVNSFKSNSFKGTYPFTASVNIEVHITKLTEVK